MGNHPHFFLINNVLLIDSPYPVHPNILFIFLI